MDLHPNVNDGEVYKTVCFSKQGSCSCDHYKAIKVKNCGYFYVYRFDGVPTCDATYCGVKGKIHIYRLSKRAVNFCHILSLIIVNVIDMKLQ